MEKSSEETHSAPEGHGKASNAEMDMRQPKSMSASAGRVYDYHNQSFSGNCDDQDVVYSAHTNPMMDRIRLTLREQLLQTRDRVKLELREQEDALKKAKREREDAGIELYGVQQQLDRLKSSLRAMDKRYDDVSNERAEGERKMAEAKKTYAEKLKVTEKLRQDESKYQEELDTVLHKTRQAKVYNESMKSEAAVTRTVANKTGEDFKVKANDKLAQDKYVDSLNCQVTRLEDEIALIDAQLHAQKEQSAGSRKMIRDTSGALEKLASEQRRLVQQWNSSVVALGRRDQALLAATNALGKVQVSMKDLGNENVRFKRDIDTLHEDNESLKTIGDRLDNEISFAESNIAKLKLNIGNLSENFEMLQESLKNTIQADNDIAVDIKMIESETASVTHKCGLLIRERHAIEEKITNDMHERASLSKVAQDIAKEEKSIQSKIHQKEIESASIFNEIARLDLHRLNAQAHNAQLQGKLDEEQEALRATEARINALEGEIKRCNDEIEIKTMSVAKLNREYNKMLSICDEEEPTGPLEATIKYLSNEIEQEYSVISELQKEWLVRQTELIKVISKTNAIQEQDGESAARLSILKQKALRLNQNVHSNESALKSIEFNARGLHKDAIRLNDLIEQNTRRQIEYVNKIALNTTEFERELAELDEQSISIEAQVADVKTNRAKLLDEIAETESQIQLWEQKIQIEKETQVELHTSKDARHTKGMQKEIQRMKHRLDSMVRAQEQLLRDMEFAIHKREDIAVKYKTTKGKVSQQNLTKGELAEKVEMKKFELKRLNESIRDTTSTVAKTQEDLAAIRLLLTDAKAKLQSARSVSYTLQKDVDAKILEKTRLQSMCELQEELASRYEALKKGELPPVHASKQEGFLIERDLETSRTKMKNVANIITGLSLKFGCL
eukprot:CCRYP_016797-RA/>CCRYP_016797-RA protein AED:0.28 eAED:0.23 QI:0/0/0/1/1/1/2/0/903